MTVKDKPTPLVIRALHTTMNPVCDVCGFSRRGKSKKDHTACSKIRQQRGFAK